jgi:hypothetical protein
MSRTTPVFQPFLALLSSPSPERSITCQGRPQSFSLFGQHQDHECLPLLRTGPLTNLGAHLLLLSPDPNTPLGTRPANGTPSYIPETPVVEEEEDDGAEADAEADVGTPRGGWNVEKYPTPRSPSPPLPPRASAWDNVDERIVIKAEEAERSRRRGLALRSGTKTKP